MPRRRWLSVSESHPRIAPIFNAILKGNFATVVISAIPSQTDQNFGVKNLEEIRWLS